MSDAGDQAARGSSPAAARDGQVHLQEEIDELKTLVSQLMSRLPQAAGAPEGANEGLAKRLATQKGLSSFLAAAGRVAAVARCKSVLAPLYPLAVLPV